MHLDPVLPALVTILLALVATGIALRSLGQPFMIASLVVGSAIGPHAFELVDDVEQIQRLGALGVVFLLFFVGLEMPPTRIRESWRVALIGTAAQIGISIGCVAAVGLPLSWSVGRIVLIGFVISLSSTAVVMRLLQRCDQPGLGTKVLSILLAQDVAVVPMMVCVGALGGQEADGMQWTLQIAGSLLICALLVWMVRRREWSLPALTKIAGDKDLRVFVALAPCLGLALITGLLGLSTGLGAFMGGMLVAMGRETRWVAESLHSFESVFVGFFFLSIGMLVDLSFLQEHVAIVVGLVALVLVTNTFVNAAALRLLGSNWREALQGGALLAQIGEFSFILAGLGLATALISDFAFQVAVATIALSMVASPPWLSLVGRLTAVRVT